MGIKGSAMYIQYSARSIMRLTVSSGTFLPRRVLVVTASCRFLTLTNITWALVQAITRENSSYRRDNRECVNTETKHGEIGRITKD